MADGPWALVVLGLLVLADAFLVVVPGEAAVTAFAALGGATGSPPLAAVIAVAGAAAFVGDSCCYAMGRSLGLERWRWMRTPRVQSTFAWARRRLESRAGTVVFTARFIPFARIAVNLTAGASRVPAARFLPIVGVAALAWATYQALIGAVLARILPGGPVIAVVVSVAVALLIGAALDAATAARWRRLRGPEVAATDQDGVMASDDTTGYDMQFLTAPVPLPRPQADPEIRELGYPRFTVLLDTARKFAAVTAVNIDGETLQDLPRTGEWELDARVDASAQAGPSIYAANDLDRGHLVRRRDPGWGSPDEARAATEATFVYTNAAPQAAGFNQSKLLWLGLEDHVLAFAEAQRLRVSVFTAPVLGADDPPYRGIRVPRRFYKVAAWTDDDGALRAAGFLLDQSSLIDAILNDSVSPLGAFRTFQVPIGEISTFANVEFGPLVAADVLVAAAAREPYGRELESLDDIVL